MLTPVHRRFFPLAAWLLVLACLLVAPLRVRAAMIPPQKTASGFFGPLPSGRSSAQPPSDQDCIRVAELCSYKPASGRAEWLSRDPIGEVGGFNIYVYAGNRSTGDRDAFGLIAGPQGSLMAAIAAGDAATAEMILNVSADVIGEAELALARTFLRKVAACTAIYAAYDAVKGPGCNACKTKAEAEAISLALTAEIAGRTAFLAQKCDYVLMGSIARGSAAAEKGHQIQLAEKAIALAKCAAKIAALP